MKIKLVAALTEFAAVMSDLDAAEIELLAIKESAPALEYQTHCQRFKFMREQIAAVQKIAANIACAVGKRPGNVAREMPPIAYTTALMALQGGTLAVQAAIVGARNFIDRVQNPDAPTVAAGMFGSIQWVALGSVLDQFKGVFK